MRNSGSSQVVQWLGLSAFTAVVQVQSLVRVPASREVQPKRKVCNSVALSTFILLCNYYHCPSPELFHHPKLKIGTNETVNFPSPFPQLLITFIVLSVFTSFTILIAAAAKSLQSCPTLCNPWTISCQAPLSIGFSRLF